VVEALRSMLVLGHITGSSAAPRAGHSAAAFAAAVTTDPAAAGGSWEVPVSACVATRDQGIDALVTQLEAHRSWLQSSDAGRARRRERLQQELAGRVREALSAAWLAAHAGDLERAAEQVASGALDPYAATQLLLASAAAPGNAPA
jgi:putative protein kinase ArgK-like GTPase of G3E family